MAATLTATLPSVIETTDRERSILRQTQALIGLVILSGVAGAALASLWWVIVPAIVGVGLVVAGITGVCPMALLIARLPWNRGGPACSRCG